MAMRRGSPAAITAGASIPTAGSPRCRCPKAVPPISTSRRSSSAFDEYKRVLADKVGAERAQQILTPRLHNSLIYPNVSIMGLNIHVRVIKPVAVDRTEVTIYPIRLVGAPPAMNFGNVRLLNVTHSAASFVQTDDLESFACAQQGLRSRLTD